MMPFSWRRGTAAAAIGVMSLCAAEPAAGPAESEIQETLSKLGAASPEERGASADRLKGMLEKLDLAGDRESLKGLLKRLSEERRRTPDREAQTRLDELIDAYRGGAEVWRLKFPDAMNSVAVLREGKGGRFFVGGKSHLGAYDLDTGKPLWERRDTHATALELKVCGETLLAAGPGWLARCDPGTGRTLWERKGNEIPEGVKTLTLDGDRVVAAGIDINAFVNFNLNPKPADYAWWIRVYDAGSGNPAWQRQLMSPGDDPLPGGVLGVGAGRLWVHGAWDKKSWLGCYDLRGGEPIWVRDYGEFRVWESWALCPDGKRFLAWGRRAEGDPKKHKYRFFAGCYFLESGKPLWEWGEKERLPAAFTGSILLLGQEFMLWGCDDDTPKKMGMARYAVDSGKQVWQERREFPGRVTRLQEIGDRLLIVGRIGDEGKTGWAGCYDQKSGRPLWERLGDDLPGSAAEGRVEGNAVYLTGLIPREARRADFGNAHGSAAWVDSQLWLGGYDLESGRPLWKPCFGKSVRVLPMQLLAVTDRVVLGVEKGASNDFINLEAMLHLPLLGFAGFRKEDLVAPEGGPRE